MSALPVLVAPGLPDPSRAEAAGGFVWWYADLVDAAGDGLVVIVAFGLPFLPGYASAARQGTAPAARRRPAICVAEVRGGRLGFWALHETDPDQVVFGPDVVRLGASRFEVELRQGRVRMRADLCGVLPGCPWRCELAIDGPLRRASPGEPAAADHEWTVVSAVAEGRAKLEIAGVTRELVGRAYLDRNAGDRSLDGFGLASWTWGRLAFPGRERLWYAGVDLAGNPSSMALTIGADGATTVERGSVTTVGRRTGRWGLDRPATVLFGDGLRVDLPAPLDDSPFYARHRVDAVHAGERGVGFAEVCRPGRIDSAWFRPLLAMTVCKDHDPSANSWWLPLFGGPPEGRLQRLVSQ